MSPQQLALAGFAGMPLAMLALPVYLHTPALYARDYGMALGLLGALLFVTRLLDTALDPLLGLWQDRLSPAAQRGGHLLAVAAGCAGFAWLVAPLPQWPLAVQMAASLLLVYVAHGWLTIALLRYGAALWPTPPGRARVAAWREGWGLAGVMLAAALPAWWAASDGEAAALQRFVWVLLPLAGLGLLAAALAPPPALPVAANPVALPGSDGPRWWQQPALRRAGVVLLLNAVAMAIPATLLNFYVADVLQAPAQTGVFLLAYFVAAGVSLPGWVALADRIGKVRAWQAGMALALAGFAPVAWLGAGDSAGFVLVCVLTGAALGADLAFASALVADALGDRVGRDGGAVFGTVSMLNKLALALAAGITLPLAQWAGYTPGQASPALLWLYAGLPALFKLWAGWWLGHRQPAIEGTE